MIPLIITLLVLCFFFAFQAVENWRDLQDAQRRLNSLQVPICIWRYDPVHERISLVWANDVSRSNYLKETGQDLMETSSFDEVILPAVKTTWETREPVIGLSEWGMRHWQVRYQHLTGRDVMSAYTDVTLVIENLRRQEEANANLERFAFAASHDLQEPLRQVRTWADVLQEEYWGEVLEGDDAKEMLNFIITGANRMQEMVSTLLDYSRTKKVVADDVPLRPVVEEAIRSLSTTISDRNASVMIYGEPPTVRGDGRILVQVFQNILSNALKFSEGEPSVEISFSDRTDGNVDVHIRDYGIGIRPEHQSDVFTMFTRLNTEDRFPGSGMGLALAKKMVTANGGEVTLSSEGLGEGSTATVRLVLAGESVPS